MKSVNLDLQVLMEVDMILIFELWNLYQDTLLWNRDFWLSDLYLRLWPTLGKILPELYLFEKSKWSFDILNCIMPPEEPFHLFFFYHVTLIANFDLSLEMFTVDGSHFLVSYVVYWQLLFQNLLQTMLRHKKMIN
jgi:hypothetical protein